MAPIYPKTNVKVSLNALLAKKGSGALTETYCREWLNREIRVRNGPDRIKPMTQERWMAQQYAIENIDDL